MFLVLGLTVSKTATVIWPGLQLYQKETPTQVFFCEICEIFNNTYFEEHLWTSASKPKIEYQHSKHLKVARERRCKYVMNLLIFNQSAFTNWFYENLKKSVILHFTFGSQNRFKLQKLFICWCVWFTSLLIITRIDVLKVLSQLLTHANSHS